MDVGGDEEGGAADAGGAAAGLHPVALHAGHQPQRSIGHRVELVAHAQPVGKPVQVQARVHRPALQGPHTSEHAPALDHCTPETHGPAQLPALADPAGLSPDGA